MKINEVEQLVGITRRNIRFYEAQGLLAPARNTQNGYREYGEREVEQLRQIKLLRKLGVPLEEIHRMQTGQSTLGDGMRRHLVTLEREMGNLEHAVDLCRQLKQVEGCLEDLDAGAWLQEMEDEERRGTTFQDKHQGDQRTIRYIAPIVVTFLMVILMGGVIALIVWAFSLDPVDAPPLPVTAVLIAIPAAMILGVVLALLQRIREIRKGEADDARNY